MADVFQKAIEDEIEEVSIEHILSANKKRLKRTSKVVRSILDGEEWKENPQPFSIFPLSFRAP